MQRPSSVTTFGILHIVFALAGVGGIISTLNLLYQSNSAPPNPVIEIMLKNPAYATWTKVGSLLGMVACIALLAAGVGLLRLKEWGRKLSISYAVYGLVAGTIGIGANLHFLVRPFLEQSAQKQGAESAMMIAMVFGAIIGGIASLIYPISILSFMTRPRIKAAFRPAAPPPLPGVQAR